MRIVLFRLLCTMQHLTTSFLFSGSLDETPCILFLKPKQDKDRVVQTVEKNDRFF